MQVPWMLAVPGRQSSRYKTYLVLGGGPASRTSSKHASTPTMSTLTGEFGAGALFGSALAAAGIYSPATIQAQMRLTDFTMLKTFIAASASGA